MFVVMGPKAGQSQDSKTIIPLRNCALLWTNKSHAYGVKRFVSIANFKNCNRYQKSAVIKTIILQNDCFCVTNLMRS